MKNKCTAVQMSGHLDGLETVVNNPKASDMTLRDHFAGLAMQGAIACAFLSEDVSEDDYAIWAYRYADAMIKERLE